ncbi:DUF1460 domain-containing protein [Shimwellia pseudoproteus]|nr:DUF1460 domain-containing protein [Shimwellia pseudoproteus]
MKAYRAAAFALCCISASSVARDLVMDSTTSQRLDTLLTQNAAAAQDDSPGERQARLSAAFVNTPYRANTLVGSPVVPETLVVNFNAVDCLTLLEYLHALAHATDRDSFLQSLVATRYKDSQVAYSQRKHFFSDWSSTLPQNAVDITATLTSHVMRTTKTLNRKSDGTLWLPGIPVVPRTITWIPTAQVTDRVLEGIQDGDLIGIYTPKAGLDVTHSGIALHQNGQLIFRNASFLERNMKVADTPLRRYLQRYPGIVVLRPR